MLFETWWEEEGHRLRTDEGLSAKLAYTWKSCEEKNKKDLPQVLGELREIREMTKIWFNTGFSRRHAIDRRTERIEELLR